MLLHKYIYVYTNKLDTFSKTRERYVKCKIIIPLAGYTLFPNVNNKKLKYIYTYDTCVLLSLLYRSCKFIFY